MARYVLRFEEPLASATSDEVIAWVAPSLQRYLTGKLEPLWSPDERPPAAASIHSRDRAAEGPGGRGRLEHPRPGSRLLAYTEDSVWRNREQFIIGRDEICSSSPTNGLASWIIGWQGLGRSTATGSPCASSTRARRATARGGAVRQRAVGVRRARADAASRGQHQRRRDGERATVLRQPRRGSTAWTSRLELTSSARPSS